MPNLFTVEELVIDDSFYCYCLNTTDDENIHTAWQRYATDNPLEKQHIEEARLIVLGLHSMLQQRKSTSTRHYSLIPPASQTSYAVNSLLMAYRRYSSRIAFIIGFCITALLAVFSIPVRQSATQPDDFRQTPAAAAHNINAMQPPLRAASGHRLQKNLLLYWHNASPFADKLMGIAVGSHNKSFTSLCLIQVKLLYINALKTIHPALPAGDLFSV